MLQQSLITAEILLVEDILGSVPPVQYILKNNKLFNKIHIARNPADSFEIITKKSLKDNQKNPFIIIINSPFQVEDEINSVKKLIDISARHDITTVILTNNSMEEFLLKRRGINGLYIKRPFIFNHFINKLVTGDNCGIMIIRHAD